MLGVPAGNDIAVIGTSFGQPRTPGWCHNMRADPKVEVTYQGQTVKAIAREAGEEDRQAIGDHAKTIYVGYEAYASRIKRREIYIMILGTEEPQIAALRRASSTRHRGGFRSSARSGCPRAACRAQITRFGVTSGSHPADQSADHIGGSAGVLSDLGRHSASR
jgi:deazaflavin-dependent oxidoreductase (nitroreductase family)